MMNCPINYHALCGQMILCEPFDQGTPAGHVTILVQGTNRVNASRLVGTDHCCVLIGLIPEFNAIE
jgi:hypothetical protein